jgi:hypothetical protein
MITVIVQFVLPKPVTRDKAQELFLSSAPKYRQVQGLIRKYYLLSEDGATSGGSEGTGHRHTTASPPREAPAGRDTGEAPLVRERSFGIFLPGEVE